MNEFQQSVEPFSEPETVPVRKPRFSSIVTVSCLLFCLSGLGLVIWEVLNGESSTDPTVVSRDLERVASRLLGLESRMKELSVLEQVLYRVWGQPEDTQDEIRGWYAEMVDEYSPAVDRLYLGVLQAERGLPVDILQPTIKGADAEESMGLFRELLDRTYFHSGNSLQQDQTLQARLAEEVPANWFYFQLAIALAAQDHDVELKESLRHQFVRFTDPQFLNGRLLLVIECGLVGIGVFVLFLMGVRSWRNRKNKSHQDDGVIPSLWSFGDGFAVLVRGGAVTILLIGVIMLIPNGGSILETYGSLLLYVPTVILAVLLLGRAQGRPLFSVLCGQRALPAPGAFLSVVVSIVALGLLGDLVIVLGGEAFEWSVDWKDWFLPQLVWGSQLELLKTGFEVVLLAPVFEEIIFRGLLYPTLRAKFTILISIIGSALIFALAHGYGLVAFLTVFWSGLLWAWAYERTGSILPAICAHVINNGLVVYSLVAIFR